MRFINWKDQYDHMSKPRPKPRKIRLEKVKFILENGEEVTATVDKEIKNLLKWQPRKITLELVEREDKVYRTYRISTNGKKNKKKIKK